MPILSDLLVSRGVDPASLENYKRCDICRRHGPKVLKSYACTEEVCRELWGDLADRHWKSTDQRKKDIRGELQAVARTLLNRILGRNNI